MFDRLILIVSMLATALLYGLVAVALLIQFVTKKILIAVPWTVAAFCALSVGFFALGRQFFCADNAKHFVEKFLPPRKFERKTLSLALIELMIVLHEKICRLKGGGQSLLQPVNKPRRDD